MADPLASFPHEWVPGGSPMTLLALHGTGGDERDLLPLAAAVAPGASVLSPRGRVSEGGMARFFRRHAEGVFDEDSIRTEAAALAGFVTAATGRHALAGQPLVALGYSNGANMAAALLLLYPGLLAGAVLLRGMLPLQPDPSPDLMGVPVVLLAGERDPVIPAARVEALAAELGRCGAVAELAWQPAGHGLTRTDVVAAAAWLTDHFPAGGSDRA